MMNRADSSRYIKSDMLMNLTDEVIDKTCERFSLVPRGCSQSFSGLSLSSR